MTPEPSDLQIPPVSPAAPGPLYAQVVEGIKREVGAGRLEPGQALPSFRALAESLLVSLITVKRAYEELEREGIVYRKQGLGTFVSDNGAARSREVKRIKAEEQLRRAAREAAEAGVDESDFIQMAQQAIRKEKGDAQS